MLLGLLCWTDAAWRHRLRGGVGPPQAGLSGCHLRLRDPGSCLHPRMRAGLRNGRKWPTHSICSPMFLNQCFLEQFWVHRTSSRCTEIPIPADSPPSFPAINTPPEGTLVLILTSHSHGLPQAQDGCCAFWGPGQTHSDECPPGQRHSEQTHGPRTPRGACPSRPLTLATVALVPSPRVFPDVTGSDRSVQAFWIGFFHCHTH